MALLTFDDDLLTFDDDLLTFGDLAVTPTTVNHGQINIAYNQAVAFSASGGTGPYTFELFDGALPTGMTFNPTTKKFVGVPTVSGMFPDLIIQATDSVDNIGQVTVTLVISNVVIIVTPTTLANGFENQIYVQSPAFSASGGTGPYTFELLSGTEPTGLTFNPSTKKFEGTPTVADLYDNLVIQATDALDNIGTVTVSILINPEAGVLVQSGPIATYQGDEETLQLRIYLRYTFVAVDGRIIVQSKLGGPFFLKEVNCTVASHVVTYDSFRLDSTVDALSDPKQTSYTFALYTTDGTFRTVVASGQKVPATNPTTLAAIMDFNG